MSVERNKQRFQRLVDELFNAGNMAVAHELVAPEAIDHEEAPPGISGTVAEQLQQIVGLFHSAFPNVQFTVDDMIGEGDKVAARVTISGTHQGEFMGIPASGRPIDVQVIDILRFGEDGMMVEHWAVTDNLSMLQQLGAVPVPG